MERRRVIIGIHGLANKPPADEKTRWWEAAIAEGLTRNEGIADPRFSFEFVYWADLRYDAPLTEDDNREPYRPYDGDGPLPGGDEAPTLTANDVLAPVYAGIDALEEATGVTLVDDVILENRFDDLWHYHAERNFAQAVRSRLIERLRAHRHHRILLVAHSMGSVIAYDALRHLERDDPSLRIDHLVTAAAPLGLAKVKLKFESEHGALRVPNNVSAWTNLADGEDVVAIMGRLAADYGPNDAGVRIADRRVLNCYLRPDASPNHHKSYGYLRTPEFSRVAGAYADSGLARHETRPGSNDFAAVAAGMSDASAPGRMQVAASRQAAPFPVCPKWPLARMSGRKTEAHTANAIPGRQSAIVYRITIPATRYALRDFNVPHRAATEPTRRTNMKRLVIATATLLALSLAPAMASGCCGKGGKGMCAKPMASMSMKGGKKGCCCEGMGKKMAM